MAKDYLHEPVPARQKGKDNYPPRGSTTYGSNAFHYVGKDCLSCHTADKKAAAFPFSMAGTVYKDILGSEPLEGAEVIILDSAGTVIAMTTNAAGNFMTTAAIADANPDPNVTTRTYKTWVVGPDGKVLPMVTMTSGSCNMHHTPLNRRGTMWAGSWSAAPNANAPTPVSYTKDVSAIFAAKCTPCHVPAPDFEKLLDRGKPEQYDYTGGFDLVQYNSIMNDEVSPAQVRNAPSGRPYLNLAQPADSLLLAKMLGDERSHGGGRIAVNTSDKDYQTLLRWIQEKATNDGHTD